MVKQLITDNIDIWSSAIQNKKSVGRGKSNKIDLYGIKKLRELILEFAVRGLLVSQDPDDEPASVLLEKITAEKDRLLKDKKIKKQKLLPEIAGSEIPFELPPTWEWARLQNISSYIQRGKGPKYDEKGKVRVVSQKCIQWSGFDLEPARCVNDESLEKYQEERYLQPRDLLWNSTGTGTVGRINILDYVEDKTLVADSHVTVIRTLMIDCGFIWCFIAAPGIQNRFEPDNENALVSGSTKQVELNTSAVVGLEIPVPPLKEQHRIVAKVDELMVLCDALELQQEDSIAAHKTLVETLLTGLTNTANQSDFEQAWIRITDHFDILFTTEHSINQLKQTVLQLAVMGKLVSQDPNDEPASELLKKIAVKRAKLVSEGKIKNLKPLPPILEDEIPLELPSGWEYVQFGTVAVIERGGSPRPIKSYLTSEPDGLNWIKIGDTEQGGKYITSTHEKIRKEGLSKTRMVYPGDFLLTNSMSFGRPYITKIEGCIHDGWLRINPPSTIDKDYLYLLLSSPYIIDTFKKSAAGAVVLNLNADKVREVVILIPPIEEQHRIVAKVDELMALCDTLNASINTIQITQLHLADAIGVKIFGRQATFKPNTIEENKAMKITTQLTLGNIDSDDTALIAPLVQAEEGNADAKLVWSKTKLDLPSFYKQLKKEIEAGFIAKPAQADFEG